MPCDTGSPLAEHPTVLDLGGEIWWWKLETHTFHLPWGEVSITLHDVTYYIGLHTDREPIGGYTRDFQRWHGHLTWGNSEYALSVRPVLLDDAYWGVSIHAQDYYTCPFEMATAVGGFPSLQPVVMGSTLLCHTYHLLCTTAGRDVTDIASCMPFLVSWIYHGFPCFSPVGYDVVRFPLAARLAGLGQQSRDRHDGKIQILHRHINGLTFDQESISLITHIPGAPRICLGVTRSQHRLVDFVGEKSTRGGVLQHVGSMLDTWQHPDQHVGACWTRGNILANTWRAY
ncbi:hypothetical protein AHAS_Ahas13G0220000 [Arachis hypogaea]